MYRNHAFHDMVEREGPIPAALRGPAYEDRPSIQLRCTLQSASIATRSAR